MSEERTILLIEPQEDIREEIKNSLSDKPCRFVELEQAGEALMQVAVEGPALVVLTLEQPDADGLEVLRGIRDFDAGMPIIVLIGEPTREKVVASKKAGTLDILLKPPDYDRLASRAANVLWEDPDAVSRGGDLDFEEELQKHQLEEEQKEKFEEAIPKGAEIANINDVVPGMKLAKTLVYNDVVYGDKGQVLTQDTIKHLNRMGVPELCVYTDPELKRKAEEKKKKQARADAIRTTDSGAAVGTTPDQPKGEKVFAKVKRSAVRVDVDEEVHIKYEVDEGMELEMEGRVVDVSAGGCGLITKDKLKRGNQITLDFSLDNGKFPLENVKGVVRYAGTNSGSKDYPYRAGIYFTNLTERFRENLISALFRIEREQQKEKSDRRGRFRRPR